MPEFLSNLRARVESSGGQLVTDYGARREARSAITGKCWILDCRRKMKEVPIFCLFDYVLQYKKIRFVNVFRCFQPSKDFLNSQLFNGLEREEVKLTALAVVPSLQQFLAQLPSGDGLHPATCIWKNGKL